MHVSFQSTGIITVNALDSVHAYVRPKERGRGINKRRWGIEMNEARSFYLQTYGKVDTMDHMMKNTRMF